VLKVHIEKELEGFKLDVEFESRRAVTALFAPSGSGKSLTLKAIAGLIEPDRGVVKVSNTTLFDSSKGVNLPPQKRKVGYLFQDYALFPNMTVLENIRYGSVDEELTAKLLRILQIEGISDRYPSEISGGQKQRVALARALAMKPRLLLLDEPFSALDKGLKLTLYKEVKELRRLFDIPVVLVSHDIDEVFELADYMVVMKEGKTVQAGTPAEVFMNPANLEVARLFGHKSFLRGKVVSCNRHYAKVRLRNGTTLRCKGRKDLREGEEVSVSVLPFSVALTPSVESTRVEVTVRKITKGREFTDIEVELSGEVVELTIPSPLSPNFILEENAKATFYLCADFVPVIKESAL